jgi:ribosomal protein L24E
MAIQYCGGCSNHVDTKTAIRWVRPDGKVLWFCSEECRVVGENIDPPAKWAPTPKSAIQDDKKAKKATLKRGRKATRKAKRPARKAPAKKSKKAPVRKAPAKKAKRG